MHSDSEDDPYAEEEYSEGGSEDPEPQSERGDEDEDEDESDPEVVDLTSDSPIPEPAICSLDEAIKTAPVAQIRSLLTFICQKHESARKVVSDRLLAPIDSGTARKRKAFETCQNCGEEYNVLNNGKGVCVFHPGRKIVECEGDFWADHDERCHGLIRDLQDDPNCEDGFEWTCCDYPGADGCVKGTHKPGVYEASKKRVLY